MFARHDLVWPSTDGWRELEAQAATSSRALVTRWREADWPLTVRRRDPGTADDRVCVGIAFPPDVVDETKKRIALHLPHSSVRDARDPLTLGDVLESAPQTWREPLASLDRVALALDLSFHVYGSLALQALTGQRYIRTGSDIDLAFRPHTHAQLFVGIGLLTSYANLLLLDGEIIFPGGIAVAWREWIAATQATVGTRVLTKDERTVALRSPAELLATLRDGT